MKLLELHIRNIASIEKADIDFENQDGLMDRDTGKPAQKFLIFGDTGTGKSVLLDAIAMALYRTTPRIEEVSNSQKMNNWFRNSSGQEVSLVHIEQYTRMGISEKDECYSEVVFLDSHGRKYRAKLELGYTRSKSAGHIELKYKKKWLFWDVETEWTEIKKDRENMIAELIGMTFSQFNRMAMLAQGQFAQFLCGKRDQRADILEKLTNTAIFSKYGAAIGNIYKRKADAAKAAKQHLASVGQFVMDQELVAQLKAQMESDSEVEKAALDRIRLLGEKLSLLKRVGEASETMSRADKELEALRQEKESDIYKRKEKLCLDWDQTDNERRAYENMLRSKALKDQAEEEKKKLNAQFMTLSAVLDVFCSRIAENEKLLGEEKVWIESRADRSQIYGDAKLYCEKLLQYRKALETIEMQRKELKERRDAADALDKDLVTATEAKDAAEKEAFECQTAIDELIKQRDALNPQVIDARMAELQKIIRALEKLTEDYKKLLDKQTENNDLIVELKGLEESLQDADNIRKRLVSENDAARDRYEKALARLTTIRNSLSDTLDDLRKKMVDEHAETCPLCGQHISDKILTKEQFSNLISPFDKEEKEAKTVYGQSQQRLTSAEKKLSELLSRQMEKRKIQDAVAKEIDVMKGDLEPRMEKASELFADRMESLGLSIKSLQSTDNIYFLDKQKQIAEEELQTFEKRHSQAKEIQSEIDKKLEIKKMLDIKKDNALKKYQLSASAVEKNNQSVNQLVEMIDSGDRNKSELIRVIDGSISTWFADWTERIDDTMKLIKTEADEYLMRKRKHEEGIVKVGAAKEKAAEMEAIRKRMVKNQSFEITDSQTDTHPVNQSCTIADWNSLSEQYTSVNSTIDSFNKSISENKNLIDSWIRKTNGSVEKLEELQKQKDDVSPARQYLNNHEANVRSWTKSRVDAAEVVIQGREALQLADDDMLPPTSETEEQLRQAEEIYRAAHDRITETHSKIDANDKYLKTQEEAMLSLQAAEKESSHWETLNKTFGGERFRNIVQTHILRPLLQNANVYLHQISDRYTLTCDDENEQLSVFVLDAYNRDEVRSVTVLSGGEKFMISLALSLALSSLNRPDMNMNILFIDEGFGTLDQEYLDSVMKTLGRLSELADQRERRVGIISHREELLSCIPNKIKLVRTGEGRSRVDVVYEP